MVTLQQDRLLQTEFGARFFQSLAEAEPKSALITLKRTVGTWSKEELRHFTTGRRQVVWTLEKIARWKHLFADSARLLLALAETENEGWSNNASGVFAGLFVISLHRQFSRTEAAPQERFLILKEAFESPVEARRKLALQACEMALKRQRVGVVNSRVQMFGKQPDLWIPTTYGELFDAYRQIWNYLYGKLDSLAEDERQKAIGILLMNARDLNLMENLSDMVIKTLNGMALKPYIDKQRVLQTVLQILRADGQDLPEDSKQSWEKLKEKLTGNDFHALMQRYVGMDIFEDRIDKEGNLVDQAQPKIEELAQQTINDPELLRHELDWLVTGEAKNGFRFGYQLGQMDIGFSFLSELVEAQKNIDKNKSVGLLAGYLRALFENDEQRWEILLDDFVQEKILSIWVPELTWRSGIASDRAALRVLQLANEEIINIDHFRMFVYGNTVQALSESVFNQWIEFLLTQSEVGAVYIALPLYSHYYQNGVERQLPKNLTLRLLTSPMLFQKSELAQQDQMASFYWEKIGKAFVQLYPSKSLELADIMLEHFGKEETVFDGFLSKTQTVLFDIAELNPEEIWKRIVKYLDFPIDSRAFRLTNWLGGKNLGNEKNEGTLSLIPVNVVWRWVDKDIEERAWYLASFVPKQLFRETDKTCWAREVLVQYGSREDVRRNLRANFSTESWWGNESTHLENKERELLEFRKDEDNSNVRLWLDEFMTELRHRIEQAKIEEEREVD